MFNKKELEVLSSLIKAVRLSHPNAWWQLKREAFDYGYLQHYPIQGEFNRPAMNALMRLPYEQKAVLKECLLKRRPALTLLPEDESVEYYSNEVVEYYARLVVEEIVRRAQIAANRTNEW